MEQDHIIRSVADYVSWTETTAVYPRHDQETAMSYELLGALSELGEVCGMFKRELRDPDYTLERLSLKKEIGDIAWYLARIHYSHDFDSSESMAATLTKHGLAVPESKNCFSIAEAIYKHFKPMSCNKTAVIRSVLGMAENTVFRSEEEADNAMTAIQAKLNTDDEVESARTNLILSFSSDYEASMGIFMKKFAAEIGSPLGLLKWFVLCDRLRFDYMEVLRTNYRKLEDRKDRNKLHGSGDTR